MNTYFGGQAGNVAYMQNNLYMGNLGAPYGGSYHYAPINGVVNSYQLPDTLAHYYGNSYVNNKGAGGNHISIGVGGNSSIMPFEDNYYGIENLSIIEQELFYDFYDDASLPMIQFTPILTEPTSATPGFSWKVEIDAINKLVSSLKKFDQVNFIQAVSKITDKEVLMNDSVVKVVITENNTILYYSRLPIPYSRGEDDLNVSIHYRCLGLYLYSRGFLNEYSLMNATELENVEHIEQLRVLENNITINAIEVNDDGMSVDTSDDLIKVRDKYRDCFKQ